MGTRHKHHLSPKHKLLHKKQRKTSSDNSGEMLLPSFDEAVALLLNYTERKVINAGSTITHGDFDMGQIVSVLNKKTGKNISIEETTGCWTVSDLLKKWGIERTGSMITNTQKKSSLQENNTNVSTCLGLLISFVCLVYFFLGGGNGLLNHCLNYLFPSFQEHEWIYNWTIDFESSFFGKLAQFRGNILRKFPILLYFFGICSLVGMTSVCWGKEKNLIYRMLLCLGIVFSIWTCIYGAVIKIENYQNAFAFSCIWPLLYIFISQISETKFIEMTGKEKSLLIRIGSLFFVEVFYFMFVYLCFKDTLPTEGENFWSFIFYKIWRE